MPLTTLPRLSSLAKAFWSVVIPGYLAPCKITELLPCPRGYREQLWLGYVLCTCMFLSGLVWAEWTVMSREGTGLSGGPGFASQGVEVQAKSERSESCFHLWLCCPERTERGQIVFTLQVSQWAQGERSLSSVLSHKECVQWAQSWKTPMLCWFNIDINRRWSCYLRELSSSVLCPFRRCLFSFPASFGGKAVNSRAFLVVHGGFCEASLTSVTNTKILS